MRGDAPWPLFAHQGGWDEVLYLVIPIVLAIVVIIAMERRARRSRDESNSDDDGYS